MRNRLRQITQPFPNENPCDNLRSKSRFYYGTKIFWVHVDPRRVAEVRSGQEVEQSRAPDGRLELELGPDSQGKFLA